jgi:hypothetical protein
MTTALMTANSRSGLIAVPWFSRGASESAEAIQRSVEQARLHLLDSISLRDAAQQALDELFGVAVESLEHSWDGYGAEAIQHDAYAHAWMFIQSLPTTVPKPSIGADPDGEVSIDWLFSRDLMFSLSIGKRGRLTFASLIGDRSIQGTDWLHNGIPATILDELTAVASEARRSGLTE